jgi:beta-lactamase class A
LVARILHSRYKSGSSRRTVWRRRRWALALVATMIVVAALAAYANVRVADDSPPGPAQAPVAKDEGSEYRPLFSRPTTAPPGAPDSPDLTLAGHAYEALAPQLPGISPEDVGHVRQSIPDPSWASVRVPVPDRRGDSYYAVFMQREGDEWRARRSVLMEDQEYPAEVKTVLEGIPEDLINPHFPPEDAPEPADAPEERALQVVRQATDREDGWEAEQPESVGPFHVVRVSDTEEKDRYTKVYLKGEEGEHLEVVAVGRDLTNVEAPGFPQELVERGAVAFPDHVSLGSSELVVDGEAELERDGLERARRIVEEYPGTAGFYALDLKSGTGYGVRPDEPFFSASTIKIAVMIAVYRRIEEGKLDYSDTFETQQEDWAAGAGWLRWDTPGVTTTVEDSLWLMMTESDNVATNALVRLVGGPEYVNEVARSLGAKNTELYWKLSSERAAVPSLDNRTTPRDMATLLEKIATGEAGSDFACEEMLGLLRQNMLEYWMEAGVPDGVPVANKAGWLDATFNDTGVVEYEDRPYVLAIFTKYGPERADEGTPVLQDISGAVWLAQTGKTVGEYEKAEAEGDGEGEPEEGAP